MCFSSLLFDGDLTAVTCRSERAHPGSFLPNSPCGSSYLRMEVVWPPPHELDQEQCHLLFLLSIEPCFFLSAVSPSSKRLEKWKEKLDWFLKISFKTTLWQSPFLVFGFNHFLDSSPDTAMSDYFLSIVCAYLFVWSSRGCIMVALLPVLHFNPPPLQNTELFKRLSLDTFLASRAL